MSSPAMDDEIDLDDDLCKNCFIDEMHPQNESSTRLNEYIVKEQNIQVLPGCVLAFPHPTQIMIQTHKESVVLWGWCCNFQISIQHAHVFLA